MDSKEIFFDIEKTYSKVNREKIYEQLENMRIQGRMMEFIRELIGKRWIKVRVGGSISQSKQTDLGIPQGGVLSILVLSTLPGGNQWYIGKFGNGVNGPLFANDLAI